MRNQVTLQKAQIILDLPLDRTLPFVSFHMSNPQDIGRVSMFSIADSQDNG